MLEELRIRDLGVIDEAVLDLSPGLTVLTGETGAGKTMVVGGLALLLGGRGDAGLVRDGAPRLLVEGRLRVEAGSAVATRAVEAGAEIDDGAVILARSVSAEGRSRAYVGGRSAPVGLLAELGESLVALHGQHDQQRLLTPARQRDLLDRYGGDAVRGPREDYRDCYDRLRQVSGRLETIVGAGRERAREADALRAGIAEVAAVAPSAGEDERLAAEVARLSHADALRSASVTAHDLLQLDPDAGSGTDAATLLGQARRALGGVAAHDAELAGLAERVGEVSHLLADVTADLATYLATVDADPLRLAGAQERQAELAGLTRKYGDTVDEVLRWAEGASRRLVELDGDTEAAEALRAEAEGLRGALDTAAAALSAARAAAATRFDAAVGAELAGLAMGQALMSVEVRPAARAGRDGADEVEMLLRPAPGAAARPLARAASGGELSRIMLAVQVVLAGADPVPTFVFDEVDAGVGGKAAVEVGRRLARLTRHAQVVVVTHLPQVAAFADRHLVVARSGDGQVTRSGVRTLNGRDRVRELSRMLAGQEDSRLARAHAEELLETAAATRAG